jgi:hypothetical protein
MLLFALINHMTLRWTTATVMEVNGEDAHIGSKIPRYQMCTVEVNFATERKFNHYHQRFREFIPDLSQKTPAKKSPHKFPAPATEDESGVGRNLASIAVSRAPRHTVLYSASAVAPPATSPHNPPSTNQFTLQCTKSIARRLCLLTMNMGLDKMVNRISKNFAEDVETWYHMHRDSGTSHYYCATRPDRDLPYCVD